MPHDIKNTGNKAPNEKIASLVVEAMTGENVLSISRMATGDQNFVFATRTTNAEYVIRMTDTSHKYKFHNAVSWQQLLLPLGVPLAKFINADLDGQYSPYPSLLMMRLPGDDLVNVYPQLTNIEKENLAKEMIDIQSLCNTLPDGPGYGILNSYDVAESEKSWFDFLSNRLKQYRTHIAQNATFDPAMVTQVINIAQEMEDYFKTISPKPFLWDASERNVLVKNGKITGIVDVDEICFGDPLFVIALTSTCLELEGFDTVYTNYWAKNLHLDGAARTRLDFYKLFYAVAFMRKHSMETVNNKKVIFDMGRLKRIYHDSLFRLGY